jgi:CRP/FNR family transcriptional regulator, nitrogen oxide reductase regulator
MIAEHARLKQFARGDELFREGDPGDALLVIVEGRVKIFKSTASGKQIILEIFGPGEPLGAVAVYEELPFPASALALEDTTCIRVEARGFYRLLEQHPALVRGLLSGLSLRIAELTRRLTELTGGRVETRFARLFLKLAEQMGREEQGGIFVPMPLHRQELADLTGTTIETCIRIMSRWEKDNVVHTGKDGFVILDRDELEVVAGA